MTILDRWHKDMPETKNEKAVFNFMDELIDRSGFDGWWGGIDEEIQIEILESLVEDTKGVFPDEQ